ncbi:fibrillin-2-like [Sabethes cyaneus]|uniref:fibrillin-2-like n=1 Tax=Sabethes cyaneus TaxID=53552 RepID=UPI00237E6313|nr:fibrillin-2-like [Sabethes cyaneus]
MSRKQVFLAVVACWLAVVLAQDGIKGWRKGGGQVVQMISFNQTEPMKDDRPSGNMMIDLTRGNGSQSALDKFMNKTKSQIPTGVCFEEVPTASLLHPNTKVVPAGNGSDPSLSRIQVCCKGYERNVHNFRKCDPVCEEPCVNSLCVGPNTCSCYPDFVKNQQGKCVPTCPIGCDNGDCDLGLQICVCKDGYELDETHKFCVHRCTGGCGAGRCVGVERCECDEGYGLDEDGKCVPKCERGCTGGDCVAPGVCQCRRGYEETENGCEPVCSNGCFNAICTAPETCTCKPGYAATASSNKCEPTCDKPCLNGDCTGANTCTCHRGYILDETNQFKCLAHCPNGCPNGVCSGPNMCLCNAGFIKDRSLKGSQACIKRPDLLIPITRDGSRPTLEYVRRNGRNVLVARNKCCRGYVRQKHKCVPVCTQPCENSKCTGPNYCTCNDGYRQLSNFRCIPHCESCDNGFCIRPGFCQCDSGYQHAENGSCVAECNNCENGYCSEPNVCRCQEGYTLGGSEDLRVCEPFCDDGCPNGKCTAPSECTCLEGFILNENGQCGPVPTTTTPEPCEPGFEEINEECRPICDRVCVNGECTAPNQCTCYAGYSNENSTYFECQPVCSNGCLNGDCLEPGRCNCHKGYGKIADECIPLCDRCSLGHCVRPNECVCDRGYDLIDGDCVPICEEECRNARCTGPNSCTCLPGYNYTDINSLFECLPVCEDECPNGVCVAPETCECNPGFIKDEESCVEPLEVCRARCINGICDKEAKCVCNRGYILNMIGLCEKTCPDGCIHGECIGGECLCNENYRLSLTNSSVCEPICDDDYEYENGCYNGRCVEPNVCQCEVGYTFIDGSRTRCQSIVELQLEKERQQKQQLCLRECRNGVCEQGYCQCETGYVNPENLNHRCVPLCDPICRNATCVEPDRCECHQGYEFYNDSVSVCFHEDDVRRFQIQLKQDHCEDNCRNGFCEEGKCVCPVGFVPSVNDEFNCQPYCEKPCLNGVCAGNSRCRCFEGYKNVNDGSTCEPDCEQECLNGHCVGPNECECNSGYVFVEGSKVDCEKALSKQELIAKEKQKTCKAKCKNGICVEGVCKCSEGYYNADKSKMTCEPWCELGCTNGQCVDSGVCVCNEGYELQNSHDCKPICTEDCVNGFCGAPERCDCSPGYRRTLDDIICKPDCGVGGCTNGHCVAPDICECFAGYQQNEDDSIKCDLIPEIIYKVDSQSNSLMYNVAYVKYFIPLAVIATLITAAIVTMIVLRNKKKDYHVGKLETKENCVYFMPQPPDSTKDDEDRFSV